MYVQLRPVSTGFFCSDWISWQISEATVFRCSETSCLGILEKITKKTSIAEFFLKEFFREYYFEFSEFFQKNILLFLAFILLMTVSEVGGFSFTPMWQCVSRAIWTSCLPNQLHWNLWVITFLQHIVQVITMVICQEVAIHRPSVKNLFWEISQNSLENTCNGDLIYLSWSLRKH